MMNVPSARTTYNANTLRCRTGMSKEGAAGFLAGKGVGSNSTDKHVAKRFNFDIDEGAGSTRQQATGSGRPPRAKCGGVIGNGDHIKPGKKMGGGKGSPKPSKPDDILTPGDKPRPERKKPDNSFEARLERGEFVNRQSQ